MKLPILESCEDPDFLCFRGVLHMVLNAAFRLVVGSIAASFFSYRHFTL